MLVSLSYSYSKLRCTDLVDIKNNYPELDLVFNFLDKLTFELKSIAHKEKKNNTIIFIDYNNFYRYYVNIDKVNFILNKIYHEYYFEYFLSILHNDIELKNIWSFEKYYSIFSKNLFIVLKNFFYNKKIKNQNQSYVLFNLSLALMNLSVTDFNDVYCYNIHCNNIRKVFNSNKLDFVTITKSYKKYLPLSYETFNFSFNENNTQDYCRYYKYFELKNYLKGKVFQTDSTLTKLDKSIQLVILVCFMNARFIRNKKVYSDNSFIKSLIDSHNKVPNLEEYNFKECLHFNNLLKITEK